jgi:hypothetical protein
MTPNGPRLSVQQLEHASQVYEKRVQAKKLEIDSYSKFRDYAPITISMLMGEYADPNERETFRQATENFFTAKVQQGILDLEELELQVKALKQARSGIVIPR